MTSAEPEWIMVAGGVLGDPQFVLEKYRDDGGLSLWAGWPGDGNLEDQISAAVRALPIPNGKVRIARASALTAKGWRLAHTPHHADQAADPDRHYDAVHTAGAAIDLDTVEGFISAFESPIENPGRRPQ